MSNQEMSHRLYDILSTKAALGMGRDSEGILERYGSGVYAGKGTKIGATSNPWIDFLHYYSGITGIPYNELLQDSDTKKVYRSYKMGKNYREGLPVPRRMMPRKIKTSCPKGEKLISVRSYTTKKGSKVKPYKKCIKRSTSKAPKRSTTTKKKCPKGKKAIRVHPYTRKTGKRVKSFQRCITR